MALSPYSPLFRNIFNEINHDNARFEKNVIPYWLKSWDAVDMPATMTKIVDDKLNFGINLDVTLFKPEELKVSLEGHTLTIEGNHEVKDHDQYLKRTFVRKWTLPEECDLKEVHSQISKDGHLIILAPKQGQPKSRTIPIEHTM